MCSPGLTWAAKTSRPRHVSRFAWCWHWPSCCPWKSHTWQDLCTVWKWGFLADGSLSSSVLTSLEDIEKRSVVVTYFIVSNSLWSKALHGTYMASHPALVLYLSNFLIRILDCCIFLSFPPFMSTERGLLWEYLLITNWREDLFLGPPQLEDVKGLNKVQVTWWLLDTPYS